MNVPARRVDAAGRVHVDLRVIIALALPLVANSAVQMVLNLTDVWFVGRISTRALAAVSSVHWLAIAVVMVLSGIGIAVQTIAAQSFGAGRRARASQSTWIALWGVLLAVPLFLGAGFGGLALISHFGLPADIETMAGQFWLPRVAGSPFGAACWAMLGFFNGIGRPRITLLVTAVMALSNAFFNELFIFKLGLGVAGSGYATTVAQALGLAVACSFFLSAYYRSHYRSHLTWRPHWNRLLQQFRLGLPMGLLWAADLIGMAIFQIMMVQLDAAAGAATQMVMVITAIAYMPGVGIALAGTTLVGQSIGAGDSAWAFRLGNRVVMLAALYMGGVGLLLALSGPWLLPLFLNARDAGAPPVLALGLKILWLAAAYQFFDGINLGSGFCLRGAADAIVPAVVVLAASWLLFVPLAHILIFAPGQGWMPFLPNLGYGALGGWAAVVVYVLTVALALLIRWRSRKWQRIHIQ